MNKNFMYGPTSFGLAPDFVIVIDDDGPDPDDGEMDAGVFMANLSGKEVEELSALEVAVDLFAGLSPAARRRTLQFLASWCIEKEAESRSMSFSQAGGVVDPCGPISKGIDTSWNSRRT